MYKPYETSFRNQSMTIREKLYNISFSYVMFIVILAAIGIVMLYSAANGGTLLDVGSQYGDGFFHHAGGLDHLRQEHFALPEQIAYDLHGRHQQLVDHRQGRAQRAVAFERVLLDVVGHALEHGVFDAFAERLRAPGVGMLCLRRAGFGELRGVFREAFGGVCAAAVNFANRLNVR